jgi:GAF domain-containing protein
MDAMTGKTDKKEARYQRIYLQISDLLKKTDELTARMATTNAVLYHKMDGFFWVGFYLLREGRLLVGPYQGPLACMELTAGQGVCWAGINRGAPVIVPDVHAFPGHIACDPRSKSEIVVPLTNRHGTILGVLDIDSNLVNHFNDVDAEYLKKITELLFRV